MNENTVNRKWMTKEETNRLFPEKADEDFEAQKEEYKAKQNMEIDPIAWNREVANDASWLTSAMRGIPIAVKQKIIQELVAKHKKQRHVH